MTRERVEECVFCSRHEQPGALFEAPHLYVMPDKYPLIPGHTLIIAKAHLPCWAAAAPDLLRELEEAARTVRRFLSQAYAPGVLVWENGIAGQSVYHAHLHLLPVRIASVPQGLDECVDVAPVHCWADVTAYLARYGAYRYAEFGGERRVIAGPGPALEVLRPYWAEQFGLHWGHDGWVRATTPEDVRDVGRRWVAWASEPHGGNDPGSVVSPDAGAARQSQPD